MNESSSPDLPRQDLIDAIEDEDPAPHGGAALLDQIPNAYERAQLGLKQAKAGKTIFLDEL